MIVCVWGGGTWLHLESYWSSLPPEENHLIIAKKETDTENITQEDYIKFMDTLAN